jgi:DnaJ domain
MNYYEELGIPASAGADDIRKAHRMLSKLLHPDLQSNSEAQSMAKIQMSRINAMVDTLLDPRRRLQYDQSLRAPPLKRIPMVEWRLPARPRLPAAPVLSLLATVAVAILLTLGTIWFLGGSLLHLDTRTEGPRLSPQTEVSPRAANPIVPDPASQSTARVPPEAVHAIPAEAVVATDKTGANATPAEVPPEVPAPRPAPEAAPPPQPAPPQPLASAPPALDSTPPSPALPDQEPSLAGLWIYSPSLGNQAARKAGMYEPEYIQLRIDIESSALRGEYTARYHVPDRPISSEVEFVFEGKRDGASFPWNASDGTRGTVDLKMLSARLMQVNWRVEVFGARIGLGAGTALLARQLKP